jgi:Tol biopolymer transport system component
MIGTNLAHYRITSHLGTGGMGEVYQATDSRLGRNVAIKLLPEALNHDSDRAARFEREAQVLAALNHPNIASIYGVEESTGRKFLILEFVDGETLAAKIRRGPIPVVEAIGIAIQITQAMEAAHEKGIVHRDLKPANIKITSEGNVKVLDFGLAKAFESESATSSLSDSPTLSMTATRQGVILGTAAYMSPEQAKARAVDRRADIFAFGAVLYEMLTGRPAFEGEDTTDILSSILKTEPDWSRLPADVPPAIRGLLKLCLQKDPRKRRQTATDVKIDIEHALSQPAIAAIAAAPMRKSHERAAFITAGVALIAVAGLLTAAYFAPSPPPALVSRFSVTLPPGANLAGTAASPFPTVSPDGRYIVYAAKSAGALRLWLRPINSLTAQPIPGTEDIFPLNSTPFWSWDSRYIGFFASGKLKKVAVSGGLPTILCEANGDSIAGTWSVNDVILFEKEGSIYRVGVNGGIPTAIRTPSNSETKSTLKFPYFLPDGRHFLYVVSGAKSEVRIGDLNNKNDKPLFQTNSRVLLAPPNYLLFIRDNTLMAQRFDLKELAISGDVVPVAQEVAFNEVNGTAAVSASDNGTLVYRAKEAATMIDLTKFDRNSNNLGIVRPAGNYEQPRLSPDKNSLAAVKRDSGTGDVFLIDIVRGTSHPLTSDLADDLYPIFSLDGKQVAFASNRGGAWGIYVKPADGGAEEKMIHKVEGSQVRLDSWSSDYLIYETVSKATGRNIWALPMTGEDRKVIPVTNDKFVHQGARLSPNGRWIFYASNKSGRPEIYVQAFPPSAGVHPISTDGVSDSVGDWGQDGKEIVFQAADGKMMAVVVKLGTDSIDVGIPKPLFQVPGPITGSRFAMSADGQEFIIPQSPDSSDRPSLTTVLNWAADLKK